MEQYLKIISRWKKHNIKNTADLDTVLSNFRILFAYHSGAIENPEITYHNTREIFENGKVINFTGDLRTLYEIENQKLCYEFLKEKIIHCEPVTAELVKEIHKQLTAGTYDERRYLRGERPGEFKKHDYIVGDNQGAPKEEVESEITELCEELTDISDAGNNIIKAAAYLHCKFENTHPFADGNGRVGRTLMNYFLMTHSHPPIVVRNESKDSYYQALGVYDKTGSLEEFVQYMMEETVRTWEHAPAKQKKLSGYLEKESVHDDLSSKLQRVHFYETDS
ncbi:MAG: Fic family protein [Lachnospiraceae bacterium]